MKNIKSYLILAVAGLLGLAACTEKETYTPAQKEEGVRYYFSSSQQSTVKVTPTTTGFTVLVYRTDKSAAATKQIAVTDTTKNAIFFKDKEVTVNFVPNQVSTTINFPISMDKLNIGTKYALNFKIETEGSAYAPDALTVIVDYPEPWEAFAKPGTFQDNYYFAGNDPWDVIVEQNGLYPNRYRVATPYKGLLGSSMTATASDYLEFEILPKGSKLNGTDITEDGIVVFKECNIGYHHSTYDEDIVWFHVSDPFLAKKTWYAEEQTMTQFSRTSVIEWIDKDNLVPGIIQFDPFYMLKGLYGGWWAEGDKTVTLIMPDYVILDTSIDLEFNYFVFDQKYNPSISVKASLGEDVELARAVAIQGTDVDAALEGLLANEDAIDFNESGDIVVPLPEDAETGKWSVVAATYTKDGDEFKLGDAAYVSVNFVKAGDTPNPNVWEYGPADIVEEIEKDDLLSRKWSLYGGYYDADADKDMPIQKLGAITITDFEDAADAEEDLILVKGMGVGAGEQLGFDDTMAFEYYEGVIYSFAYEPQDITIQGTNFIIQPEIGYEMSGKHYGSAEDPYLMLGGLVSENILAFVETDDYADYGVYYDYNFYWSVYTKAAEPTYVTDLIALNNIRFISGEDEAPAAPAPRLSLIKKSYKARTNHVETNRAYMQRCIREHSLPKNIKLGTEQVIEKGKVGVKKVDVSAINR